MFFRGLKNTFSRGISGIFRPAVFAPVFSLMILVGAGSLILPDYIEYSPSVTKGHVLYGYKRNTELKKLSTLTTPSTRSKYYLSLSNKRLSEASFLLNKKNDQALFSLIPTASAEAPKVVLNENPVVSLVTESVYFSGLSLKEIKKIKEQQLISELEKQFTELAEVQEKIIDTISKQVQSTESKQSLESLKQVQVQNIAHIDKKIEAQKSQEKITEKPKTESVDEGVFLQNEPAFSEETPVIENRDFETNEENHLEDPEILEDIIIDIVLPSIEFLDEGIHHEFAEAIGIIEQYEAEHDDEEEHEDEHFEIFPEPNFIERKFLRNERKHEKEFLAEELKEEIIEILPIEIQEQTLQELQGIEMLPWHEFDERIDAIHEELDQHHEDEFEEDHFEENEIPGIFEEEIFIPIKDRQELIEEIPEEFLEEFINPEHREEIFIDDPYFDENLEPEIYIEEFPEEFKEEEYYFEENPEFGEDIEYIEYEE